MSGSVKSETVHLIFVLHFAPSLLIFSQYCLCKKSCLPSDKGCRQIPWLGGKLIKWSGINQSLVLTFPSKLLLPGSELNYPSEYFSEFWLKKRARTGFQGSHFFQPSLSALVSDSGRYLITKCSWFSFEKATWQDCIWVNKSKVAAVFSWQYFDGHEPFEAWSIKRMVPFRWFDWLSAAVVWQLQVGSVLLNASSRHNMVLQG